MLCCGGNSKLASFNPLSAISHDYVSWNARLFDFVLREGREGTDALNNGFFLTVSTFLDAQPAADAEAAFVRCVRETYAALLQSGRDPLSVLTNRPDEKGPPLCTAFLGLSVLAAEKMEDNSYYPHLAELLCQSLAGKGKSPIGFDTHSFEDAWKTLNAHLERRGFRMEEPPANGKRFVRWPQMHALLRQTDLVKLPRFFHDMVFHPSRRVSAHSVENRFDVWSKGELTPVGTRAWGSDTQPSVQRPAIVQQILRALEQWDGQVPPPNSPWNRASSPFRVQRVPVRLLIDMPKENPSLANTSLFLQAPRPVGFPTDLRFPNSDNFHAMPVDLQAQAGDDFYPKVPLPPNWAQSLARAIGMESRTGQKCLTLKAAPFYVFQQSEWEDWETYPYLRVGMEGMILCTNTAASLVQSFLDSICRPEAKKMPLGHKFPGWTLFHAFRPIKPHNAIIEPNVLEARAGCLIRPVGGLRLGHKQEWLHGAPPDFIECVGRKPDVLQINEAACFLVEHKNEVKTVWRAPVAAHLSEPGDCTIWAGQERYRLCLVSALMPDKPDEPNDDFDFWDDPPPFAAPVSPTEKMPVSDVSPSLPPLLLDAKPHFIGPCPWRTEQGEAAWILTCCDRRVSVLALSPCPPLPQMPPPYLFEQARYLRLLQTWAEGILRFAPARIGLMNCATNALNEAHIAQRWRKYVEQAAGIRRRIAGANKQNKETRHEKRGR